MAEEKIRAELLGTRVIVWNLDDASTLYASGFYGLPVGIRKPKNFDFQRPLELSLIEACYLIENDRIEVYDAVKHELIDLDALKKIAEENVPHFEERYIVYKDLRKAGYVVRPGLKFGTDFAIYEYGPGIDHAPFMVHVHPKASGVQPLDIVRAGRLATTVRKRFVVATVKKTGEVAYYAFQWYKP